MKNTRHGMARSVSAGLLSLLLGFSNALADNAPAAVEQVLRSALADLGLTPATLPVLHRHDKTDERFYETEFGPYQLRISANAGVSLHAPRFDAAAWEALEAERRRAVVRETLAALDEKQMLIFQPPGEVRHTLTVFTDITCPYSTEFHRELDWLLEAGVRVRYLALPRLGKDSIAYYRMRAIWCAPQAKTAWQNAMDNQRVKLHQCNDAPLDTHMALADALHIVGTPSVLFADGGIALGYHNAIALLGYLEEGKPLKAGEFSGLGYGAEE